MTRNSSKLTGLGLLIAALMLTGCIDYADFGDSQRFKEDFHFNFPLPPGGTVTVDNSNGPVEIIGWEQETVEVNGTKYAASKGLLDTLKVDASSSGGSVRLRTLRPADGHGGSGARYTIRVPRKTLLDSVATTNGSIRIEDVQGDARLRSTNGAIRVEKLRGSLDAHSTNGRLEIHDAEGNQTLQTSNGSITSEIRKGSLEARTSNGAINVTIADATANWPVRLHSSNGHIEARLQGNTVPDIKAETSNSSITLMLPGGTNARLRAHTSHHSSVHSEFDVASAHDSASKGSLEGNIGTGGPVLDLETSNGSIKILKQ